MYWMPSMVAVVMRIGCLLVNCSTGGDPLEGRGLHAVSTCLRILVGDHGGRHSPMNVGGRAGTVLQLISAGDPLDLAGLEVRALSEGEAGHRCLSVALEFYRVKGAGVNTPTTRGTHRSRYAPLPCAHSQCGGRQGRNAWQQTQRRCARGWCRWRGESSPTGCPQRSCQERRS